MSRPAQGSDWTSSGTGTPPPTSKYSTIRSRDDFFLARQQQSVQSTTASRPRTASTPPRRIVREPVPINLPSQQNDYRWNVSAMRQLQSDVTYGAGISDESFIGMALGSPRDNPLPLLPHESSEMNSHLTASPHSSYVSSPHALTGPKTGETEVKHKGKWKMFGGLFGKKDISGQDSPSQPFYSLQHTAPQTNDRDITSSQAQIPSLQTNGSPIQPRPISRGKNITRDSTKRNVLSKKQKQELKPDRKGAQTTHIFRGERRGHTPSPAGQYVASTTQYPHLDKKSMMLQVNIPDVSMERYSVMFSDVLKTSQPSLMTRRQTQLVALNTMSSKEQSVMSSQYRSSSMTNDSQSIDSSFLLPTRRATSPSPQSPSHSFSLFPAPRSSSKHAPSPLSMNKASTLQRSATAPAALSPARAAFELSKPSAKDNVNTVGVAQSPARSSQASNSTRGTKWFSEHSESTQASPVDDSDLECSNSKALEDSKKTSTERTNQSFDVIRKNARPVRAQNKMERLWLTDGSISDDEPILSSRLKIKLQKSFTAPQGENVSESKHNTSLRQSKSLRDLNTSDLSRKPSGAERHLYTAQNHEQYATRNPLSSSPATTAEISVARQISLSRRQRQLLVPIVPKKVRQPMQPTLVDVDMCAEMGGNLDGRVIGHVSRKSHHVLVEYA